VVIPAIGMMNGLRSAGCGLMHSYHNVAKLRQFRGVRSHETDRSPAAIRPMARRFACRAMEWL
jgi:hypothetical protein